LEDEKKPGISPGSIKFLPGNMEEY
jgi:hypothetical protein